IPLPGKGSLYINHCLWGVVLFWVSNYFKEGLAPINLIVEIEMHRATPGGTGGVKTIVNYAAEKIQFRNSKKHLFEGEAIHGTTYH
ncbi:UNVERIFIED_CONTAM: Branched-chain-amino-acid aminotransferase 5, chloroplastic, partial [Sesamum angustifolium]